MIARRLIVAWRGRSLWLRLCKRHNVDDGVYVVALIEDDPNLNEVALAHLPDLIADRRARGVVVLATNAMIAARAREAGEGILAVEELSGREMDALLSYYELYVFSPRILVVSLTRPVDNQLSRMVGVNGLMIEDLVCLAMYQIRGWIGTEVAHG